MLLAILSTLLISEVKSQVMPQITVPETFPSGNQNKMIDPAFVNSPYLAPFIEYVKAKVNPKYLAIPQSVYRPGSPSSPNYANNQEGPALENCYWPYNLCTRNTDTADFKADISKCPNDNDWGLTYDDGPMIDSKGLYGTPQLLAALAAKGIKATFFVVGSNAFQNQQVLKDADAAGHQLATHSWTHHPLTSLSNEQMIAELIYSAAIVLKATGKVPIHFRPPYGDVDDRCRAIITALGMRVVYWTTDPSSFDSQDASFSANDANKAKSVGIVESWWAAKSQAGFISLEHDITTFTVQIALEVLARIPADSTLKPQTVGTCLGLTQDQWYSNSTPRNPSATTTSGQTTTSSQTTVNGTPITGDDGSEKVLSKNSVSGFFYGSLASLVVGFAVIVLAF